MSQAARGGLAFSCLLLISSCAEEVTVQAELYGMGVLPAQAAIDWLFIERQTVSSLTRLLLIIRPPGFQGY